MKFYTNSRYPKEKVYEDERLDWLEEHGKFNFKELTPFDNEAKIIQGDIKEEIVDYFFSDWTENEDEEQEEDREAVIDDLRYLDEVDRGLGL